VHCLHIWTIASGLRAVSAHVVLEDQEPDHQHLARLQQLLRDNFELEHITLQLETSADAACEHQFTGACLLTPDHPHEH
jgi:cobalt-zinc-cadmium efflux system protein